MVNLERFTGLGAFAVLLHEKNKPRKTVAVMARFKDGVNMDHVSTFWLSVDDDDASGSTTQRSMRKDAFLQGLEDAENDLDVTFELVSVSMDVFLDDEFICRTEQGRVYPE